MGWGMVVDPAAAASEQRPCGQRAPGAAPHAKRRPAPTITPGPRDGLPGTIVPVLLETSAPTIVDVPIRTATAFEALGAGPMSTPNFHVGDQVVEKQPRPLST